MVGETLRTKHVFQSWSNSIITYFLANHGPCTKESLKDASSACAMANLTAQEASRIKFCAIACFSIPHLECDLPLHYAGSLASSSIKFRVFILNFSRREREKGKCLPRNYRGLRGTSFHAGGKKLNFELIWRRSGKFRYRNRRAYWIWKELLTFPCKVWGDLCRYSVANRNGRNEVNRNRNKDLHDLHDTWKCICGDL